MRLPQFSLVLLSSLVLAVLITPPTTVGAQCIYREVVTGYVLATYDGNAMQVRFDLERGLMWPGTSRGNAVAFDVYRKTLGYDCGPEVRITDEPLPWPRDCDVFDITLTDPDVTLDTAYRYEARPVDADRNPARGDGVVPIHNYGVVGTALLAHGDASPGDNFTMFVDNCPSECLAAGMVFGPWDQPAPDWNLTIVVYGNGAGVTHYSNGWAPTLFATSISNSECLVAVESAGWGAVKRLYR